MLTLVVSSQSYSAVLNVPSEYGTIQDAINASSDSDTVLVAPGTYIENINYSGKTVKIISSSGADFTFLTPAILDSTHILVVSGEGIGTSLEGFDISGSSASICINVYNGSNFIIRNNTLHDYAGTGHVIRTQGSDLHVSNNLFFKNIGISCIWQWGLGGYTEIYNNTLDSNYGGIAGFYGDVHNNVITNSEEYGINLDNSSFGTVDYNNVYNCNINYYYPESIGNNNTSTDPLYVDPSIKDYNLQTGSPCIDAGNPEPSFNDPDGSTNDIGAFPFQLTNYPIATTIDVAPDTVTNWVYSLTPTISWTYLDTSVSVQDQYQIQLGTDNDWTIAETWDSGPIVSSDTSLIYSGTPLTNHHKYFMRIRVNDGSNWGEWRTHSFLVRTSQIVQIPSDYTTMDSALEWLQPFDTIVIAPGTYSSAGFSNFFLDYPSTLTIIGDNEFGECLIDLENNDFFELDQFRNLSVKGINFINGSKVFYRGIHASISLRNCEFKYCNLVVDEDYWFGGVIVDSCVFKNNGTCMRAFEIETTWRITNSLFLNNSNVFLCQSCNGEIINNLFANNNTVLGLGDPNLTVEDNIFYNNYYAIGCSNCYPDYNNFNCNNFYKNLYDFAGLPSEIDSNGNFSANPLFCDTTLLTTLSVASISPLFATNNNCGIDIGLGLEIGCYCGDVSSNGDLDISDLTFLVNYLFKSGAAPNPLQAGNIDGSEDINISDLTYFVNYLFKSGPDPVCSSNS